MEETTVTKVKYINTSQSRRAVCNLTFKEELIHQAHEIDMPGRTAYVLKSHADRLLDALKYIHKTGDPNYATEFLKEIGNL
jgi:hypothetical protein